MVWKSDVSLCTHILKTVVNLLATLCPTNIEKYITAKWKNLNIRGLKYMLEKNAMPVIFGMFRGKLVTVGKKGQSR